MKSLMLFLKQPTTKIGILTACMFQIIFSTIWMTGYHGVNDQMGNLKIVIVNDDSGIGSKIVDHLQENLPFKTERAENIAIAEEMLKNREADMVMHIPSNFSAQLESPHPAVIEYKINESNPAMIKNIMQGAANSITANMNKEATLMGAQAVLNQTSLPQEQREIIAQSLSQRVAADIESIYPVKGFSDQMVPLMLVLASFVGAMLMALNLGQAANNLAGTIGRWKRYGIIAVINIASALLISLLGSSFIVMLGGHIKHGFLSLWGFQTLFVVAFLFLAQLFVLIFGMAGMVFNIILLSLQLVTSGALVPRDLLPDFFYSIGRYLPATYAVEGNMNILFGGTTLSHDLWALFWIIFVVILLGMATVAMKREKTRELTSKTSLEMVK